LIDFLLLSTFVEFLHVWFGQGLLWGASLVSAITFSSLVEKDHNVTVSKSIAFLPRNA